MVLFIKQSLKKLIMVVIIIISTPYFYNVNRH